jgi:hypothetical protein
MPTPRATHFSRLEEPFPDDEPTSDAPLSFTRHRRIGSMHRPVAAVTRPLTHPLRSLMKRPSGPPLREMHASELT